MYNKINNITDYISTKFMSLVMWREQHITERTFVLFLAFIVGILCGSAALLLKMLIHFFVFFIRLSFPFYSKRVCFHDSLYQFLSDSSSFF